MSYQSFLRQTAIVDVGIFAVLATPFLSVYFLDLCFQLGVILGDNRPVPDLSGAFTRLTINLVGAMGLFTALCRLKLTSEPLLLGRLTGVFKLLAAALFAIGLALGAPLVLAVFLMADTVTGALLLLKKEN